MENIIPFSDWSKLDLRVAQIVKVEEISGADKLWKLTLDVERQENNCFCESRAARYERN